MLTEEAARDIKKGKQTRLVIDGCGSRFLPRRKKEKKVSLSRGRRREFGSADAEWLVVMKEAETR